jgi:hypothetical protein
MKEQGAGIASEEEQFGGGLDKCLLDRDNHETHERHEQNCRGTEICSNVRGKTVKEWDHDGDGDEDGIGDWSQAVLFFRYAHPGLTPGMHTFEFSMADQGSSDSIIVEVLP